ncbi:hypothetical protein WR25_04911 [Diploscapter pachys]|uniref:Otopetrin n=1 Tax=Diploscapter pachys TaxID=2018661 RepID=A0A2A2JI94_9BILA|nr:hypothetical protein WR25_04911 [Diploscapter pachys]
MHKLDEGIELIDSPSRISSEEIATTSELADAKSHAEIDVQLRKSKNRKKPEIWLQNENTRNYIFKLFTCFYALFIVVGGIVVELSNLISNGSQIIHTGKDLVLGIWLFGGSILFIGYCAYLVYMHYLNVLHKRKEYRLSLQYKPGREPDVLTNSSTGSLYLRIGCVNHIYWKRKYCSNRFDAFGWNKFVDVAPLEKQMRKRSRLTIDCSRTAEGLFIGFIFIIFTILAVALYNAFSGYEAVVGHWIFSCTNLAFFILATLTCLLAFWRMKILKFKHGEMEDEDASAELLDRILLVVGLIGELLYGMAAILSFINNPSKGLPLIIFITNVVRLFQVTFQSGLIIVSSRLEIDPEDDDMRRYKPGKQLITLLLMINVSQFFLNVFEAQKAGINDEMLRMYGSYYWAFVVRGCSPLTIFYRGSEDLQQNQGYCSAAAWLLQISGVDTSLLKIWSRGREIAGLLQESGVVQTCYRAAAGVRDVTLHSP